MQEMNQEVSKSFTRYSHHKNVSVIFITQNIFSKNKYMRDVTLNSHYMVIFQQKRDASQINCLMRQIKPGSSKDLMQIYKDCTKKLYSYIIFVFHPTTRHQFLIYTNIFKDQIQSVYYPKDG